MKKEALMSDIGWEEIRKKYSPRMIEGMQKLSADLRANLPEANASEQPWEMDGDDYWVIISCEPEGGEKFDISFRINESQDFEGVKGGYTFSIDIVEEGGRILGGMSPYNYTDEVWCTTRETIEERFRLVEDGLSSVSDYLMREVL